MLRGLYFMGWYRDMWNYHPSLPMKNIQMIEDIQAMKANTLIWSCLGSGAIGLPYLDREANDPTPPRLRLYGFMNDREFCGECAKRGITVYSVLWKAQLWEFPAEFNEDESELLSLNLLRGASDEKKFIGMSELSTNRYPKLFPPIEKYFPEGLRDFKGRVVGDYLEEFKAVSLEGRDILSSWLMVRGHDHICYAPCSAKTSYLNYLKRDIEMMSDAGAGGLHIDEYDTQKNVVAYAGCFCEECVENFRRYLAEHSIPLPEGAGDADRFDYRKYLLEKGYKDRDLVAGNGNDRWEIPLYRHFYDMQMESIEHLVRELSSHIRAYSQKTRGMTMKVTANLYQSFPYSWSSKKHLDILAGEKSKIELRQDGWYQFAFGWLNGKESCFVEDPNPYVRDLYHDTKDNIHDRFILFMLEPMAHGIHLTFPYGSWLQNQEKDAFWPDLRVTKRLGEWLDSHEDLFPKNPVAEIALVYDALSAYENMLTEPLGNTKLEGDFAPDEKLGRRGGALRAGDFSGFFELTQKLSRENILYNVLYASPDEPLTPERLEGYRHVIVPDAFLLRPEDAQVLAEHARSGRTVTTFARYTGDLSALPHVEASQLDAFVASLAENKGPVSAEKTDCVGITLHRNESGYVLHLVNYNYNQATHRIDPADLRLTLRFPCEEVKIHSFPENNALSHTLRDDALELRNLSIYTVVEFK